MIPLREASADLDSWRLHFFEKPQLVIYTGLSGGGKTTLSTTHEVILEYAGILARSRGSSEGKLNDELTELDEKLREADILERCIPKEQHDDFFRRLGIVAVQTARYGLVSPSRRAVSNLPADRFFDPDGKCPGVPKNEVNYDTLMAFRDDEMRTAVEALMRGESCTTYHYEFSTHSRSHDKPITVQPADYIVVDSIFGFSVLNLEYLKDKEWNVVRVYVDTKAENAYQRRLVRDVAHRGRTPDSVKRQWDSQVYPAAKELILPYRADADIIVSWNETNLDTLFGSALAVLGYRGKDGRFPKFE